MTRMMTRLAAGASALALLAGCSQPAEDETAAAPAPAAETAPAETAGSEAAAEQTESERLNAWFEEVF
jgi:ABC-type glycerol-3-phosphate transport system substrate-binding protein